MKKLIAIATLGLALAIPSFSWAFVPPSHFKLQYRNPAGESQIVREASSSKLRVFGVELPYATKAQETAPTLSKETKANQGYITVFGVRIPS